MEKKGIKMKMAIGLCLLAGIDARNFVVNGNFEVPQVPSWKAIPRGVQGWSAPKVEIGKGRIYNRKWPPQNNQVA